MGVCERCVFCQSWMVCVCFYLVEFFTPCESKPVSGDRRDIPVLTLRQLVSIFHKFSCLQLSQ